MFFCLVPQQRNMRICSLPGCRVAGLLEWRGSGCKIASGSERERERESDKLSHISSWRRRWAMAINLGFLRNVAQMPTCRLHSRAIHLAGLCRYGYSRSGAGFRPARSHFPGGRRWCGIPRFFARGTPSTQLSLDTQHGCLRRMGASGSSVVSMQIQLSST